MTERIQGQAALRSQDLRAEPRLAGAAPMPPRPSPIPPIGGPAAAPPQAGHIAGLQATGPGLLRSTLKAGGVAAAILAVFYLPAEYGVDPTGIGSLLGLTEMGEIKQQLYAEAEAEDAAAAEGAMPAEVGQRLDQVDQSVSALARAVGALATAVNGGVPPEALVSSPEANPGAAPEATAALLPPAAPAEGAVAAPEAEGAPLAPEDALAAVSGEPAQPAGSAWRDSYEVTLAPSEAVEVKLVMDEGQTATFAWSANGGALNYTTHGDGGGEVTYEDGRAVPGQEGTLTAAFTGNHGWFWRNRTDEPVRLTLTTGGEYAEMRRP